MKLIMPMAGQASRFNQDSKELIIKPLIEVAGKKLYQWALASFENVLQDLDLIFIIQKSHSELKRDLQKNYPSARILELNGPTRGPGETLNHAVHLLDQHPVVVCDCDLYFHSAAFEEHLLSPTPELATGILTFQSTKPCFSYIQLKNEAVVDIKEKIVISDQAVCGCYYFQSGKLLATLLKKSLEQVRGREVFLSDLIAISLQNLELCRSFPCDRHVSLGNPQEIADNSRLLTLKKF